MWCWFGGSGMLTQLSLCYSIVYHYNAAHWYEQFLHVGRLYWLWSCLAWLSIFRAPLYLVFMVLYMLNLSLLHSVLYLSVSWAWWDWASTWLTTHCPSVLWHCRLGYLTHKSIPKMTYIVSSGTLNHTIPYYAVMHRCWVKAVGESLMFYVCQWNVWYLKSGTMTAGVEDYLLWHWFGNVCMAVINFNSLL